MRNKKEIRKMRALATREAIKLKEHTTPEELARLDIADFSSYDSKHCIYGLMTGNCYSVRASKLINNCAERVYGSNGGWDSPLNGAPDPLVEGYERGTRYHSPIEMCLAAQNGGGTKIARVIINFLQGGINELEFTKLMEYGEAS